MDCTFCKIIAGNIPSRKRYEDDAILAFDDINPQSPVHIIVIPKQHIPSADGINNGNSAAIGHLFAQIPTIARDAGLANGYRVVTNCGPDACQSVQHLHFHIMGGRQLSGDMG